MAYAAIDGGELLVVGEFLSFEIRMAGNACQRGMCRARELLLIDKDRNRFSFFRPRQRAIVVTGETIGVFLSSHRCDGNDAEPPEYEDPDQ
jgi:hypothetical protein